MISQPYRRIATVLATAAGACAIAVPAAAGLSNNPTFSEHLRVPVPTAAHRVSFDDTAPSGKSATTTAAPPATPNPATTSGRHHGAITRHAEPGDDHGSTGRHAEPGDDHGGDHPPRRARRRPRRRPRPATAAHGRRPRWDHGGHGGHGRH